MHLAAAAAAAEPAPLFTPPLVTRARRTGSRPVHRGHVTSAHARYHGDEAPRRATPTPALFSLPPSYAQHNPLSAFLPRTLACGSVRQKRTAGIGPKTRPIVRLRFPSTCPGRAWPPVDGSTFRSNSGWEKKTIFFFNRTYKGKNSVTIDSTGVRGKCVVIFVGEFEKKICSIIFTPKDHTRKRPPTFFSDSKNYTNEINVVIDDFYPRNTEKFERTLERLLTKNRTVMFEIDRVSLENETIDMQLKVFLKVRWSERK